MGLNACVDRTNRPTKPAVSWKLLKCGSGEGLRKSWVDRPKKTNEEILNMVQEDRKILNTTWCRNGTPRCSDRLCSDRRYSDSPQSGRRVADCS